MWKEEKNQLNKEFEFTNFIETFGFMTKVALIAEKKNHHPTWTNTYNKLSISLSTHSVGNVVTEKDRTMATEIDAIFKNYK